VPLPAKSASAVQGQAGMLVVLATLKSASTSLSAQLAACAEAERRPNEGSGFRVAPESCGIRGQDLVDLRESKKILR